MIQGPGLMAIKTLSLVGVSTGQSLTSSASNYFHAPVFKNNKGLSLVGVANDIVLPTVTPTNGRPWTLLPAHLQICEGNILSIKEVRS